MSVVGLTGEETAPGWVRAREAWCAITPRARVGAGSFLVLTVVGAVAWWPDTKWATIAALTCSVLIVAAVIDLVEHRLPNPVVLAAAVPVAAGAASAAIAGSGAWSGSLAGAAVVGLPLLGAHLASPAGLGFGDVKAGSVLGGGIGLVSPALAVSGLVVGLVVTAGWALAGRHRAVPLGPGMVGGSIAAFVAGGMVGVEPW